MTVCSITANGTEAELGNDKNEVIMRILIVLLMATILACGKLDTNETLSETAIEHAKKHLDPKYVCPMHSQIVRDEPGNCPICGMNLVKKEVKLEPQETALEHAIKHTNPKYICPMHSQIVRDKPGNCPICGMTLVKKELPKPAEKSQPKDKYPTVTVDSEVVQKMGVRTIIVNKGTLQRHIKTVGYVAYNENKLVHIHPRSSGWVKELHVRREGDFVKLGKSLLKMYSPEVLKAQQDFLVALRTGSKGTHISGKRYKNFIRNRLRLFGVAENTINQIERKNTSINDIPIFAPQSGIVTHLNIREGMYVTPN